MRKIIDAIKAKLAERETDRLLAECDELLGKQYHRPDTELDALYNSAVDTVLRTKQASAAMLERKLKVSFDNACDLLTRMEREGIVSAFDGKNPRKILIENPYVKKRLPVGELDALYGPAVETALKYGFVWPHLFQSEFDITREDALALIEKLAEGGIVGPFDGSYVREVLNRKEQRYHEKSKV